MNEEHGPARMSISLPGDLKHRMSLCGERVNWSKVSARAFEDKLSFLDGHEDSLEYCAEGFMTRQEFIIKAALLMLEKEGYSASNIADKAVCVADKLAEKEPGIWSAQ